MGDRKDRVKVGRFCLDVTEVTADAYANCVRLGQCSTEGLPCGSAATFNVNGKGGHPINCVDWSQAANYCQAQGKRLPTEEEWEWAARGGAWSSSSSTYLRASERYWTSPLYRFIYIGFRCARTV